ncbi:MAG: G8 domain-containing protein [Pseudomonadota bacterium]
MSNSQITGSADLSQALDAENEIIDLINDGDLNAVFAQMTAEPETSELDDLAGASGPCPITGDPICLCHKHDDADPAEESLLADETDDEAQDPIEQLEDAFEFDGLDEDPPEDDTDAEDDPEHSHGDDEGDDEDPDEAVIEAIGDDDPMDHHDHPDHGHHDHDEHGDDHPEGHHDAPHDHHDDHDDDDDHHGDHDGHHGDHDGHHGGHDGDHDHHDHHGHHGDKDFVYEDPHLDHGGHGDHGAHAHHNSAIQALVSVADATHFAIADGDWFDPSIWAGGEVPGDGARVIVIQGATVTYEGESDARIATIRVDGALDFPGEEESNLVVDTLVVSRDATLTMGSEDNPVDVPTTITFANIDQQADPGHLGLGLLSEPGATVEIHSAEKTGRAVSYGEPKAGDDKIDFRDGVPENWEVGDTIVLAGTQHNENAPMGSNTRFQDEILTITEITEDGVHFINEATGGSTLRFDHVSPPGFDFDIHVANLTRAITFESEGGVDAPIAERGHIMVMDHESTVKNAALVGLGRTDKSIELDPEPTSFNINGVETSIDGDGTNVPGRYALHVHRAFDNGDDGGAVDFSGNAIWGSPGWGLVIHGSRAQVHDNVVFDTVGAAIVTEDGDEEAYFSGNTVIQVHGREGVRDFPTDMVSLMTREGLPIDYGFHGNGFWFDTGYSVRQATDNVVASTEHAGMLFYGHNDHEINRYVDPATAPEELHKYIQDGVIDPLRVPTGLVEGNQLYNGEFGMFMAGLLRDDQYWGGNTSKHGGKTLEHQDRNVFEDFEIWGARESGILTAYAQGFEFRDMTIVGDPENPNSGSSARGKDSGILVHKVNHNVVIENVHVEGFATGLNVGQGGSQGYNDVDPFDTFAFDNITLRNNIENFTPSAGRTGPVPRNFNPLLNEKPFNPYAQLTGRLEVDVDPDNLDPIASALAVRIDDNGWLLDASASFDPDYQQDRQRNNREVIENSIAFYQWDIDGDFQVDAFGRDVTVFFDEEVEGSRYVNLFVTDEHGARAFTTVELKDEQAVSRNALGDGGFDIRNTIERGGSDIRDAREVTGYQHHDWAAGPDFGAPRWIQEDGYARIAGAAQHNQILNQLVINRSEHRGEGTFSFDVKYFENDNRPSDLIVKLWGINGTPDITSSFSRRPVPIYEDEEFEARLLYREAGLLDDGSFDWKTITADINFRDGFDYLYVEFNGKHVAARAGDRVAIDNVELVAKVEDKSEDLILA